MTNGSVKIRHSSFVISPSLSPDSPLCVPSGRNVGRKSPQSPLRPIGTPCQSQSNPYYVPLSPKNIFLPPFSCDRFFDLAPRSTKLFFAITSCRFTLYDNPKRFFLHLGHLFCYKQRKRILDIIIVVGNQLSDISQRKIGENRCETLWADISPQDLRPKPQDPTLLRLRLNPGSIPTTKSPFSRRIRLSTPRPRPKNSKSPVF
jgi:hypothetical protein